MTAKEYLSRAYYIDQEINRRIEEVDSLKALATKCTATLTDMPSGSSRDVHRRESIICKIIDFEREITARIDELVDLKREIHARLQMVEKEEYKMLLELRYIHFYPWMDIAAQLGYSERRAYSVHGEALKEFEKIMRGFKSVQ